MTELDSPRVDADFTPDWGRRPGVIPPQPRWWEKQWLTLPWFRASRVVVDASDEHDFTNAMVELDGLAVDLEAALLTGHRPSSLPFVGEEMGPNPRHGWCLDVGADRKIRDHGPIDAYSAEDARGFAAALLAAADVAEARS